MTCVTGARAGSLAEIEDVCSLRTSFERTLKHDVNCRMQDEEEQVTVLLFSLVSPLRTAVCLGRRGIPALWLSHPEPSRYFGHRNSALDRQDS